jgi:hypothetical protein
MMQTLTNGYWICWFENYVLLVIRLKLYLSKTSRKKKSINIYALSILIIKTVLKFSWKNIEIDACCSKSIFWNWQNKINFPQYTIMAFMRS